MKKRILSILTALVLCLTLLPTAALADTTPSGTALTQDNISSYMTLSNGTTEAPAEYYLDGDVALTGSLTITGTVTLDLNGYVLSLESGKTGSIITVSESANFTLTDSRPTATTHYFTVDTNGLWKYAGDTASAQETIKTVTGGVITGGTGIEIVDEELESKHYVGGGVYNIGTFTMSGGTITGCGLWPDNVTTAISNGGGVYNSGSFTMTGGSITGCTAVYGGGISNYSTFTMNGGSITHCTAFYGGGVYNSFTFTISGTAMIENCTLKDIGGEYGFGAAVFQERGSFFGEGSTNRFVMLNANGGTIQGNIYNEYTREYNVKPVITRTATGDDSGTYTTFNGEIANGIIRDEAKLTVTFDSNYTGSTATTQKFLKGQNVTKPTDPTRDGYTFGGWYKEADCTNEWSFSAYTVTENTTLYAKWVCAGHTGGEATCQARAVCETCGEPYGEFGSHKYTTENKDAEGALKTAGNCQNEAVYYKSCSVCGAVSTSDTDTFKGEKDPNNHTGTLGEWQKDENGHWKYYSCCSTVKVNEGAHSYTGGLCECSAVQYTVTFDPNGGTVDPASATTDIDGKLTELPTPTRSGSYRFDGWFTEQNGGTAMTVDTVFTAHTTVYAHWTYTGGSSRPSYAITVPDTEHGTVKVSPRYAERGDTVTITVTPDSGYTLETLTVLDKNGKEIELTAKGDGKYTFKMPAGKVEVKATFVEDNSMLNFFVDVTADKYYYDAVLWAAKNGITGGVDENHFGPDLSCTRAQLVTFLWRAAGCPVVNYAMDFSDVGDGYYTEAVRWAASLGIVGGYGNGLFGSNDTITREQMATILYRFAQTQDNGFSGAWAFRLNFEDVSELSDWAVEGVSWCVMNDIMQGYDNNLMPKAECTRAQIVTMLYRLLGA